jgi:Pro-kumamolisin, activation domain
VQKFLASHGLTVQAIAENNMFIKVQGTVGNIQKAFHVQIDNYRLNGVVYRSNEGNPSVNSILGGQIAGITGMDDFGFQPANVRATDGNGVAVPFRPLGKVTPGGVFFEGQCFRAPETHTFNGGATRRPTPAIAMDLTSIRASGIFRLADTLPMNYRPLTT